MSDYSNAKIEFDRIVAQEQREEDLILQIKNLSEIIRKMHRYSKRNSPLVACGKIQDLFDKGKHLLSETKITRLKK